MNYLISRDGQEYGPYKIEEIQRYLNEGSILPEDYAFDGEQWTSVNNLLKSKKGSLSPTLYTLEDPHLISPKIQHRVNSSHRSKGPLLNSCTTIVSFFMALLAFWGGIASIIISFWFITKSYNENWKIGPLIIAFILIFFGAKLWGFGGRGRSGGGGSIGGGEGGCGGCGCGGGE